MIPLAFVIALAAATLVVLIVAVASLVKQVAGLARTLKAFEEETRPILEAIQQGADTATHRLEGMRPSEEERIWGPREAGA